jgi:putative colanic acid biosynthesis UDP-glucose lipid carrier transferase
MYLVDERQAVRASTAADEPLPVAASRVKRAFDVVAAGVLILLFLPLLAAVATAIWLGSPGPVLFRQDRTGLGGRVFKIYKFRTMRVAENGDDVRQATRGDLRVTSLGRILRALSIDELPQLLNVLAGDMSLVGPRPHALAHDNAWSATIPGYRERFRARPGLTGRAQVLGFRGEVRDVAQLRGRITADRDYIDTWTFGEDLRLLMRTIPRLFCDPAAY